MKKVFITIALFALAVPAALAAPPPGKGNQGAGAPVGSDVTQSTVPSAEEQCKELLRAMGAADFRSTYTAGSRASAMDKCVSREIRSASADVENAAKACKEERAKDPAAFKAKYGTNINKANAFGKCVSALASAAAEDRQEAIENAAKACKDERAKDPAAFKAKYGTNINKANAFGKCVSQTVKKSA